MLVLKDFHKNTNDHDYVCLFVFGKKGQRIYNNKFVFNWSVWSKRKVHLTKKIFQFPPGYSTYYSLTNTSAHQEKNKSKYIQERIESLKSVKFKSCYISSSRKFCLNFRKWCILSSLEGVYRIIGASMEKNLEDKLHKKWSFPLRISSINVK